MTSRHASPRALFLFAASALAVVFHRPVEAQVLSGSYVGDGSVNRPITGLGFRPDIVLIASDEIGFPDERRAVIRTSTMAGNVSKPLTFSAALADRIRSLDGDGFTVGHPSPEDAAARQSCVNHVGVTYYWTAFKAAAGELKLGTYLGDGADNRNIPGVGFQPDYVLVVPQATAYVWQRSSAMPAGEVTYSFEGNSFPNLIQALQADGFQVGNSIDINAGGVTYHYAAWKAIAGKMNVGSYTGNNVDGRSITGVGFRPGYVTVKRAVVDDAMMKPAATGTNTDLSPWFRCFGGCAGTNLIQALETNGFQVGDDIAVNATGETYYWVAFGSDDCQPLSTTAGAATLTITAPGGFEMRFNSASGGSIDQFFDLAEDPARSTDLVGGPSNYFAFFYDAVLNGWYHWTAGNEGNKLELLEATPTRVRVRQESFYKNTLSGALLPGLKGVGDWTVYPAGRSTLKWSRVASAAASWTASDLDWVVHWDDVAGPLNNWTAYSDAGVLAPSGPAGSDFLLLRNESSGARTDFLSILYADWPHAESTDWATFGGTDDAGLAAWTDTNGTSMGAGTSETVNFLTYFKPTNFTSQADLQVTSRRNDYRGPDTLTVGLGSVWHDASENTAADDFNESEAAYPLDFDMAAGLSVDLDGATTPRYHPFFKIRQWRSLQEPATVLVEGVTKTNDLDYRTDVKPVSRAHFAQDLLWHSTLENVAALETTPDVGAAGSGSMCGTAITYGPGRYGNGAVVGADDECVWFPRAGHFDPARGALEFWFRPTYNSTDGLAHNIGGNFFNGANQVLIQKRTDNSLYFEITASANVSSVSVSSAQYSWRAGDWVHLRFEWDETEPVATQLRILVNGVEPNPGGGTGADYVAADLWLGANIFVGDRGTGNGSPGVYDEIHMYGGSGTTPTALAQGGLTTNASEYLADATRNYTFNFAAVDAERRGEYVYFGADAKFRGLNVVLATAGAGTSPNLQWQFWNGTAWANLESGFGFVDQTNNLTRTGTLYWTADPTGWSPYSVNGGPDLFYVRAHLASGDYSAQSPVERVVKTDILLFQYCGDITLDAQTFVFTPPTPTAVEIASFKARGLDEAVEITWETASELNNLGFHVYRAVSGEGLYERITETLIPGLGSSPKGARYRYVDSGRVNGTTYFYKLEDVETTGRTELHGPVSATPAAGADGSKTSGSSPELTYGDPTLTALRVVERTAQQVVLELITGGFSAEPQDDGSVRLSIPGYSEEAEPGAPAIPVKRSWLEVEAGRGVRIASVRAEQVEVFSLRPTPGEAPEVFASRRGTVTAGRRAERPGVAFRAPGLYPEEAARLVSLGYQGEVKKALLELAPLRWDRSGGELVLARKLTVRLVFAGRDEARHRETASHGRRNVTRRLLVRERGLNRVSFEQVFGGSRRGLPASSLGLSRQGETVAFHLEPDNGVFGPGSTLYFASEGESLNPYGREAVYELELGGAGLRMPESSAAPKGSPTSFYWQKLRREENRYYQAGLLEAHDLWLWDLLFAPATKSYSFVLSGLAPTTGPSRLEVWLQGVSDLPATPDHHLRIFVNGALAAESNLEGKKPFKLEAEIPAGALREGENLLEIQNVGDTGASYSMVMLDRFELTYPRRLVAEGGRLEGRFSEPGVAEVEGLAANALLLDVSEELPRWMRGAEATASGLRFRVEADRSYLLVSREAVRTPEVRTTPASRLKSTFNQADYLVIGPPELLAAAQPLLDLRRERGLRTRGVSIDDVYSEFGYGESRPEAVREFLTFAYHHWRKPAPRYVLLLGDASYDFKDNLQTGVKNRVPPLLLKTSYLWTASDPAYAAVSGEDILPDLAIGRLPVANAEEARALVEKIRAYETSGRVFEGAVVLVADNADAAGNFEADAEEIASGLLSSRSPQRVYLGRLGSDSTRTEIREAFDRGAALLSYLGHGGIHLWAHENIFNTAEVGALAPQPQQPLVLTLNCLNGYFHFPYFNSLAEELIKTESKGAIAAFSPSGLSLNTPAHLFHKLLLAELLSGRHARLGDAVLAAQAAYADSGAFPELLSIYHLLGDPALRLQ